MAIGKLSKGSHAAGLIEYLLGEYDHSGGIRPVVQIVGGTMGFTSKDAKAQFDAFAQLRPSLGINVVHNSISLPASDRHLSPKEWEQIGDIWARGMGFDGYLTVCHGNHIHIAASRIKLDGSVVSDAHDYRRSEALIHEIEEVFGLTQVEASHLIDSDRTHSHITAPKTAEIEMACKGQASAKAVLQSLLTELTSAPITASDFVLLLEAQGVDVRPNISATTGQLSGFAFALDGHAFTASALGRGFTLSHLIQKGLSYEQNRDLPTLVGAKDRSNASALDRGIAVHTARAGNDLQGIAGPSRTTRDGDAGRTQRMAGTAETDRGQSAQRDTGSAPDHSSEHENPTVRPESRSAVDTDVAGRSPTGQDSRISTALGTSSPRHTPTHHDSSADYIGLDDSDGWDALFAFFRKWAASMKRRLAAINSVSLGRMDLAEGQFNGSGKNSQMRQRT